MSQATDKIAELADGIRSSREIASILGLSPRYVRRVMQNKGLPQLPTGAQPGVRNHQYKTGRIIQRDGYVLVPAPAGHPHARLLPGRKRGRILEHRLVAERMAGRYLHPKEVVDHWDGLVLHNAPGNLRLFSSNAEHLRATLGGRAPRISELGALNTGLRTDLGIEIQQVDNYRQRKVSGEIRLHHIFRAALELGTDSPYLLGTHRYMDEAGIDWLSRPTIERALRELHTAWGWDPDL